MVLVLVLKCGLGLYADEVETIGGPGRVIVFRKVCYRATLLVLEAVVTSSDDGY